MEGCYINSDLGCNGEMMVKSPSSDDNGFVVCEKADCESPLSSWNSESEVVGIENIDDGLLWEMNTRSYDELLKKFIENEEKLRVSDFKFQLSEQEIIKLKVQVENSESQLCNVREELKRKDEELHKQKQLSEEEIFMLNIQIENRDIQLDRVHELLKLREEELNKQMELSHEEVFKLKVQIEKSEFQLGNVKEELNMKEEEMQKQIAEFNTHVRECGYKLKNLMEQFEVANENLKLSKDEIEMLSEELKSKSSETRQLQNQLKLVQENLVKSEHRLVLETSKIQMLSDILKSNETNHDLEVHKLKDRLVDLQACFSLEKEELYSKIKSLWEEKIELTSKLEDWEIRNIELENKLEQYETENLKQEELHAAQQIVLQDEISSLKKELGQRKLDVEVRDKEFDKIKTERDEVVVKVKKLEKEICSRDDQISNMNRYICKLKVRLEKMTVNYETTLNQENKSKLRVEELEKDVIRHLDVISYMAEKKREAITQLCFSIDHHRTRYLELLEVLTGRRSRGGRIIISF